MRIPAVLSVVACLMGAAGVAASAAAGHGGGDVRWASAAQMLLVHAVGSLAIGLALPRGAAPRVLGCAAIAMQAGAVLFAADMTTRALMSQALFPMAAPIGGTLAIVAWIAAAIGYARGLSNP